MKRPLFVVIGFIAIISGSLAFTENDYPYTNLKILPKDITEKQMDSVMDHFSIALNVGCDFCHVKNKAKTDIDFASDDNKHKLIARDMMMLTNSINDSFFNYTAGKRTITTPLMVTCFTCHNGKKMPAAQPKKRN